MIKHGYVAEQEPFSNHIKYNTKTRKFFHPWSITVVGTTFGSREYSKFIPLSDYIRLPLDIVDDLLEGVMAGERIATEARIEYAKREAERNKHNDPAQAAINAMNKGKYK